MVGALERGVILPVDQCVFAQMVFRSLIAQFFIVVLASLLSKVLCLAWLRFLTAYIVFLLIAVSAYCIKLAAYGHSASEKFA